MVMVVVLLLAVLDAQDKLAGTLLANDPRVPP
jgi:hypothetical protein